MDFQKSLSNYMETVCVALRNSCFASLEKAADELMLARARGSWIFAAGNGGSAATASHFANDFVKGLSVPGKTRFKAMCLNDAVPILTCLANDFDYADCFLEQLKNYASKDDILVVYSGSGNSRNVVRAAEYAKSRSMRVIGFTGRDGGALDEFCDINCIAATDVMETIEDVHMTWEHALVSCLRQRIEEE